MSTIRRNREVAGIALRLNSLKKTHLFTSYLNSPVSVSADFEIELPLPTGPDAVWLSDSTLIGCAVDAADWPAWTDEIRFAAGEGVAR
jgi:hypothetical protein